jgi:CheY-like chemotaxis protein
MQQVFSNLLSNAIKYTSSGGTVRVSITSDEETVQIAIEDTGHGIEKRDLPDIFKQFAQGDSERARRSGGLGLGLSIVNILVAKHGGRVAAESEGLGKGARFVVTLPLNATAQDIEVADVTRESDDTRRLNGFNILIVEDDPDSREVLQIFLEQSGASVKTAESARAAMSYFNDPKAKRPDVLISDLAMPEEDGYSLIARIRELPAEKGGQVPALALSAFASAESRQRAFEAGFHRYLTKPFEPGLIVDQVIALRQLNDNPDSN